MSPLNNEELVWIEEQKGMPECHPLRKIPTEFLKDSFGNFTLGVVETSEGWGVAGETYTLGKGVHTGQRGASTKWVE